MKLRDKPLSTFRPVEIPVSSGVRRFAASAGFIFATLILAAISWLLWQSSFVAAKDLPAVDLRYTPPEVKRTSSGVIGKESDTVVLEAAADVPRLEFHWLRRPPARYAHISLEVSTQGVIIGRYPWDSARIYLAWSDGDGKMAEGHLPLWSGFGDQARQAKDMIVPLSREGTLPQVMIQNRGTAGVFKVHSFSVQPAELRPGFSWTLGSVLLSWIGLIGFALRRWVMQDSGAPFRIAIAAALWVGFAWMSCFPGPWIPWNPLGKPFTVKHLDGTRIITPQQKPPVAPTPAPAPAHALPIPEAQAPPVATPAAPPVAEALPEVPAEPIATVQAYGAVDQAPPARLGGGPLRWFLNHLPGLKRPIHLLAFAALTTLIALLTGSVRAVWPAFALGILSEFSQWAFGFGFDGGDVVDLAFDAVAVLAGLAMWRWLQRVFAKKREPGVVALQSSASNT